MSENVTGRIRPRGDMLEAVITVDGRTTRKATGLRVGQESEADAVLLEALQHLQERTATATATAGTLTVQAWAERWIEDRKVRGKMSWPYDRCHVEHYVTPVLGALPLAHVTDVQVLDWARGLVNMKGPSGKTPSPKYIRQITATLRAIFKEALRRHLIERTPCQWEDSDLPEAEANSRVIGAGFELADVARLIYDPRIPEDRRTLYALEFLTGMRTGEAAARTWADWEPVYRGDLGRLIAGTAYNTRHHVTKTTKTKVEKWIPVHPALAAILTAWNAEGWARFWGREPKPEDMIVPSATGKPRNNSYSWRLFADDLRTLGIEHQRHYESRSTFINLAEGAGASPDDIHRLTHASLGEAKDLYRRVPQQWPRLCAAVRCIQLSPPNGEITVGVTEHGHGTPESDGLASKSDNIGEPGENGGACSSRTSSSSS